MIQNDKNRIVNPKVLRLCFMCMLVL